MKRFVYLILSVVVPAGFSGSYAAQGDFGLSTTTVTTSVVEKVKKNLGKLQVAISTDCHSSAEDASRRIRKVKNDIHVGAKVELARLGMSGVTLDGDSSVENPRAYDRYTLEYPENDSQTMVYTNRCAEKHISLNGLGIDKINELNEEKVYFSALTMTYVAKDELSKLLGLKQFLADYVSRLNKAYRINNGRSAGSATVYMPTFGIDEATQEDLKEKLTGRLGLDSRETQISVDEAFYKKFTGAGFAEKYINVDGAAGVGYPGTRPLLLEDGSIRLQKTFSFLVSYTSTNFGTDSGAVRKVHEKTFSVDTEMKLQESDVESYVATVRVGTKCQPTRADANRVFKAAFNKAKEAVEKELKNVSSGLNAVRINAVQSPGEGYYDRPVARRLVADVSDRGVTTKRWKDTRWLDDCTGEVVPEHQRKKYWRVVQDLKILTASYAVYQKVKDLVQKSVGEADEDSPYSVRQRYPEAVFAHSPVVLKSESWRKAVDAQLYEQALYKLTDPAGSVARYLNSEYVKADKAYYELRATDGFYGLGNGGSHERRPEPGKGYDGERIIVNESNLDSHREAAAKSYTIIWRPVHDLMTIIKARAAADSGSAGS